MQFEKTFNFDRSTKGTHRFKEEDSEDGVVAIETLYIKKPFLKGLTNSDDAPRQVRVTVEIID